MSKNNNELVYLEYLEKINTRFLKSLRTAVEPFVKNFMQVHGAKVENEKDLAILNECIQLIDTFSLNEAKLAEQFKLIKDKDERDLLRLIQHELAIVTEIAARSKQGNLSSLYQDCLKLDDDLAQIEDMIAYKEKQAA